MKTIFILIAAILICGCAAPKQTAAVRNAVQNGLITGVDSTAKFETIPWAFPSTYMGPYTDIHGFVGTMTNDPSAYRQMIFFVGKVRDTKEWEVFSALIWANGEWKTLPVMLPPKTK